MSGYGSGQRIVFLEPKVVCEMAFGVNQAGLK